MTLKNKPSLLFDAGVIRHETAEQHNTALRVGSMFIDLINSIDESFLGIEKQIADAVGNIDLPSVDIPELPDLSLYATRQWVSQTYLPRAEFDEMFEWVVHPDGTRHIRAKAGFEGASWMSAPGAYPGEPGERAGKYLYELLDVSVSEDAEPGSVLSWNGSRWVAAAIKQGLDESALAAYLSSKGYTKRSDLPSVAGLAAESWVAENYQEKGDYLTKDALDEMFVWEESNGTRYIRAKAGVIGPWLSAPGNYPGSPGGAVAAGRLAALEDVGLSALKEGDVLAWDGSKWTNKAIQQGLDEAALASYLSGHSYVVASGTSAQFLKADGSVDGNHYIKYNQVANAELKWVWGSNLTHVVGFEGGDTAALRVYSGDSIRVFANAVNKAGDTMTGNLTVPRIDVGGMYWDSTGIMPTSANNGLVQCGKPEGRWSTVYANALNVTSTAVVSNLNADMLDGYHGSDYLRSFWTASPGYDCSTISASSFVTFTYANNAPFNGAVAHFATNLYGFYLGTSYNGNNPLYYRRHGRNGDGGMGEWQQLARITDNVASATKLANARTFWGQSFNGEANVSGDMANVGSITFANASAVNVDVYGNLKFKANISTNTWSVTTFSGVKCICAKNDGYVGIGTGDPEYKLDVNGEIMARGWLRSTGNVGWYSQTYSGGIYMIDTTWVRTFNNKGIYTGSGVCRSDNCFVREGYAGSTWNNGYGAYNIAITSNSNQTPLMLAYRLGSGVTATGANRLFSAELHNSGSEIRLYFGGNYHYQFTNGGVFWASAGVWSNGYVSGKGNAGSSDARLKRALKPIELTVRDIAAAPLVEFDWIDGSGRDMGTIAQYWLTRCRRAVRTTPDGYYALDYGKLAVAIGISLARKVDDHEKRISNHDTRISNLERRLRA